MSGEVEEEEASVGLGAVLRFLREVGPVAGSAAERVTDFFGGIFGGAERRRSDDCKRETTVMNLCRRFGCRDGRARFVLMIGRV